MFTINQSFICGDPPIFLEFYAPYLPLFIAFLRKNFGKSSKFGLLCPAIFFEKLPKISKKILKFYQLFQNRKKTVIFVSNLVQNQYFDQNLAKFSNKTQKNSQIFFEKLFFQIFGAFGAENLKLYAPKIPNFLELAPPLGPGSPPK